MNMREFAALCGVSLSTVSRVLSHSREEAEVSKKTYDRIRAKAAEVGFKVNYYAQVLHSRNSNCLGFLVGSRMPLLTEPLLHGLTRSLNLRQKHFALHFGDDAPEKEADAFDRMVAYNAETVFYIPSFQKGGNYSTRHIRRILEKYPEYPPVITLYGGTDIPGFHQVGFRDYETGKQAALRQLACGCRKFGVIALLYSNLMHREMIRGYRRTLLENGVPARNIKECFVGYEETPADAFETFRDAEGLWFSHYVLLLHCARRLLDRTGDGKRLHIDCLCGTETEILYHQLQPQPRSGDMPDDFLHWFGSLMIYKFQVEDIGAKAAEIALQLSRQNAANVPRFSPIELTPELFR